MSKSLVMRKQAFSTTGDFCRLIFLLFLAIVGVLRLFFCCFALFFYIETEISPESFFINLISRLSESSLIYIVESLIYGPPL